MQGSHTQTIILNIEAWFQSISSNASCESYGEPGRRSEAITMFANHFVAFATDVQLSSGEEIEGMSGSVSLASGPLVLGNGKKLETGVGLLRYEAGKWDNPSKLHCDIGVNPEQFEEVWRQVRSGAFTASTIELEVRLLHSDAPEPVPPELRTVLRDYIPPVVGVWEVTDDPPLFISDARVQFEYRR